jgi:hypothetical protein
MGVFSLKKYCGSKKRTSKKGSKKRASKRTSKKGSKKRTSNKSSFGRKRRSFGRKRRSFGRKSKKSNFGRKRRSFGRAPSLNNIMGNYGPALFSTLQEYTGANSTQRAKHLSNIPVGLRNSFYV